MNSKDFGFRTLVTAAFAVATSIATYTAFAQEKGEITVEAARPSGRTDTGVPIKTVTTKRVVSYADISLATQPGATTLEKRIREAAKSACNELEQKYPISADGDSTQQCVTKAVDRAMADAHKAIDAAKLAAN
jgi:UrcA family protein